MASGTGNLPNPGMDFTPFDILTAEEMDDLVENIESLADGSGIGDGAVTSDKIDLSTLNYKRRLGQDITTSSFLVPTNWTTRCSVTVTTTTGTVEVNYGFLFGNAGSSATRSFDLRDRVDGIASNTRSFYLVNTSTLDVNLGSVNIVRRYEGLANGSHTFDFQLLTNTNAAVRVRDEFLIVDELY